MPEIFSLSGWIEFLLQHLHKFPKKRQLNLCRDKDGLYIYTWTNLYLLILRNAPPHPLSLCLSIAARCSNISKSPAKCRASKLSRELSVNFVFFTVECHFQDNFLTENGKQIPTERFNSKILPKTKYSAFHKMKHV